MKLIGLTGSIGMGKTTIADMFAKHGVPTLDSDHIVHRLYRHEAVTQISENFPQAIENGQVNRQKLSELVIGKPQAFATLESIIHPLVRQKQDEFVNKQRELGVDITLLDIPLLFETNQQDRFDVIITVTCDGNIQRARVLARPNMSVEKFEQILKKQMPDAQKCAKSDHIVDTSGTMAQSESQVVALIKLLRQS